MSRSSTPTSDTPTFKCPECEKQYQTRNNLVRHMKNHSTSHYEHPCDKCDAKFRRKDLLTRHLVSHQKRSQGNSTIRKRLPHKSACSRCARMKIRCDKAEPCSRCSRANEQCRYTSRVSVSGSTQISRPADGINNASKTTMHRSNTSFPTQDESYMTYENTWPWLLEASHMQDISTDWGHMAGDLAGIPARPEQRNTAPSSLSVTEDRQDDELLEVQSLEAHFTELVKWSIAFHHPERDEKIRTTTARVDTILKSMVPEAPAECTLGYFVKLFVQDFNPRWPVLRVRDLQSPQETLSPSLWITFAAIGAAFSPHGSAFHYFSMHVLRSELSIACYQHDIPDAELEALYHSFGLLRVNHLYFGHVRAASAIHMLGAAQAYTSRKLDLYNPNASALTQFTTVEERLLRLEMRKRLVFGVLRQEGLVSMLFGTRPLFSAYEIDLTLPLPEDIWNSDHFYALSAQVPSSQYRLPDLVNVALDPDCALPPLEHKDLELILFGMQDEVWRHSQHLHDFEELDKTVALATQTEHLLTRPRLKTNRTQLGRRLLVHALDKCMQAVDASATSQTTPKARAPILACKIIHAASHIRLLADVPAIHRLFISTCNGKPDAVAIAATQAWARTEDAYQALSHALQVYRLTQAELLRPVETRAHVNAVSHLGLLHTAAIIWVLASLQDWSQSSLYDAASSQSLTICRANVKELLRCVARVLGQIGLGNVTPSLLVLTVEKMADHGFPIIELAD